MLMDDVRIPTARHSRYELRPPGGEFSAAIWSAGGVPRITRLMLYDHVSGYADVDSNILVS